MRLLFVIDGLGLGGAQRQMVTLARGLKVRQHQIDFFVYHPQYDHYHSYLDDVGIIVHKYPKKKRYSVSPILKLRKMFASGKYDLALSFLDTPNFYNELSAIGFSIPVVISTRNAYQTDKLSLSKCVLEQFHRLAQKIVVNSYYQAARMLDYHPWMKNKLVVIYNGLDLNQFRPDWQQIKQPNTFLCVGSVIPRKNPLCLAQALNIYRAAYGFPPNIHWYGVIYATKESQLAYKQTQNFLEEHQLLPYWRWCGTIKQLEEIYPRYQALIHPSHLEGVPNVIIEAMACGLPVLASNICEHPRLIQEHVTGFLFEPDEPEHIAEAMHRFLMLDVDTHIQMGQVARQQAEKLFDLDVYISSYVSLFKSLL